MPCYSEGPSHDEIKRQQLDDLLNEIGSQISYVASLDEMTRELCDWCKTHDVTAQSLELQIWWRDHQRADARRLAEEQRLAKRKALVEQALSKLTSAEIDALKGVL